MPKWPLELGRNKVPQPAGHGIWVLRRLRGQLPKTIPLQTREGVGNTIVKPRNMPGSKDCVNREALSNKHPNQAHDPARFGSLPINDVDYR